MLTLALALLWSDGWMRRRCDVLLAFLTSMGYSRYMAKDETHLSPEDEDCGTRHRSLYVVFEAQGRGMGMCWLAQHWLFRHAGKSVEKGFVEFVERCRKEPPPETDVVKLLTGRSIETKSGSRQPGSGDQEGDL